MMCAEGRLVDSCYDCGSAGSANSRGGKCVLIADSIRCKLVDVGCDCIFVTVTAQMGTNVFAGNPNDIWGFTKKI